MHSQFKSVNTIKHYLCEFNWSYQFEDNLIIYFKITNTVHGPFEPEIALTEVHHIEIFSYVLNAGQG